MPSATSTLDVLANIPEIRLQIWPDCLATQVDGSLPPVILAFKDHVYHQELVEMYPKVSGTVNENNEADWIAKPLCQTNLTRHLLLAPYAPSAIYTHEKLTAFRSADTLVMKRSLMVLTNNLRSITVDLDSIPNADHMYHGTHIIVLTQQLCRASLHLTKITIRGPLQYGRFEDIKRRFNDGLKVDVVSTFVLSEGRGYQIMTWEAPNGFVRVFPMVLKTSRRNF